MPAELTTRLGSRVRDLRKQAGLTQAQLADRVDVSHEFMSRLERGQKTPSLDTTDRIARSLGLSIRDLFDFETAPPEGEREAILEGMRTLLATEEMAKLRLVEAVTKTIVHTD